MRYQGYTNKDIIAATGLSEVSISKHVKNWNQSGLKAIKDTRGGSQTKLEPSESLYSTS